MDYFIVNGTAYDVIVTECVETFSILFSENTGRNTGIGAPMVLDPLGTFIGHKVTFQRKKGKEAEYDELFSFLATPRYDGIVVSLPHNQEVITYTAYVSQGEKALKRIDENAGKTYWDKMTVNFIAMEAQVTP